MFSSPLKNALAYYNTGVVHSGKLTPGIFLGILLHFHHFGILYQETSGNPVV
jgi:hypothetical protein